MNARAALEAARAVFAFSSGTAPAEATTNPEWNATSSRLASPRLRSDALWRAAEQILQSVVGDEVMTGHALITEARKQERVTLDDAHALVSLIGWFEQIQQPDASQASGHVDREQPPSPFEQRIAREVWQALSHAVESTEIDPVTVPPAKASLPPRDYTPPAFDAHAETDVQPPTRSMSSLSILVIISVLLIASVFAWRTFVGQGDKAFLDGVLAYQRGANEVARLAFIRAASERPDDPAPLVYLGRLARDEHDLSKAKDYLERAIKIPPPNAVAMREMASTLLLEDQPELARRFYVRAVEIDPTDKLAQGFLGCALQRLGRTEEATRWSERAGRGEWTACIESATKLPPASPAPARAGSPSKP